MVVNARGVLTSIRCLSSCSSLYRMYTKTCINPVNFQLSTPNTFVPKALVVLSTPSLLSQAIEESINLHQKTDLQVVVAGVDCVIPNSQRHGISEMWLDEYIGINQSIQLDERDDINNEPKERDGVHVVQAKKNWKLVNGSFSMGLNQNSRVDLQLANTVFSTGNLVTLFYFQPSHLDQQSNSGQTLCDLSVTLPSDAIQATKIETEDKWTLLDDPKSEPKLITSCIGNLVKLINGKSASSFLQENKKLMNIASKDTQVYVKIYKRGLNIPHRFKVIAGGGEWGTKSNILAISPEAKLEIGDTIEFYMLTPEDRFSLDSSFSRESLSSKLIFECSYEELSYNSNASDDTIILENSFGCGSEKGFKYNGVQHTSAGEKLSITLEV